MAPPGMTPKFRANPLAATGASAANAVMTIRS